MDTYNQGAAATRVPKIYINGTLENQLLDDLENVTVDFFINQTYNESVISYSVIGQLNGTDPTKTVIVGCLYDSWWTQGTADSAIGMAMVLAVAKYFIENSITPDYTIKFIAFGGEEVGLKTLAVRYGVTPTLIASLVITLIGIALGIIGFYILYTDLPNLVIFGSSVSFEALFVVTVVILALAYYIPLKGTWKFIKISLQNKTAEQKISLIKKQLNYPVWQLTGVLGVTFIATLFFIWKIV
jgi:hypothetical protein